jgi:hypothetical protein
MTDGAQQASQDTSHAHHSLCIKTWARTLPQASNDSHVHEQYARYLDNLESGDSVVKHSVDTLAVSRASKMLSSPGLVHFRLIYLAFSCH